MSLDNIHIPIREGRTLSIASINGKLEIAVLGLDEFFVTADYFKDWYEDVIPISDIKDLLNVIKKLWSWKMNKQELIEKFEERKTIIGNFQGYAVWWEDVKEIFEQLEEPEPVKVPQFVAKKIGYFKKTDDWGLLQVMDYLFRDKEIKKWLEDKNNQEAVARAWLDGYEVEEEKRYLVKIRATKHYISKDGTGKIFFSLAYKESFTKKELEEANFGWVFDCPGIEIEEVTE